MSDRQVYAGDPTRLGAHVVGDGVSFSVFSENAEAMHLCLFDADGRETRIALPERDGDVWHVHVPGIGVGQHYGFRAEGPFDPNAGHRFNPAKLLIDPYARQLSGQPDWNDALCGGAEALIQNSERMKSTVIAACMTARSGSHIQYSAAK